MMFIEFSENDYIISQKTIRLRVVFLRLKRRFITEGR